MAKKEVKSPAALIPSIDRLLRSEEFSPIIRIHGRDLTASIVREITTDLRSESLNGSNFSKNISVNSIAKEVSKRLEQITTSSLKPVLNLTGTVLHTNLGRAALPKEAISAIVNVASEPSNIEYNLSTGNRGYRDDHVTDLICRVTGAEAACVVNNNAAAVFLILNTFAFGKEVIVSRGELVEIGGTFRIPDIMLQAGTLLREVGTTNRTNKKDYETAINENTALIMKIHPSNFEIQGFTESVSEKTLADIAHHYNLPLTVDLGSGSLIDFSSKYIPKEKTVRETLSHRVDLVCFSGDKLIGGPQAGFIAGKHSMIKQINSNPMKRAMRMDKIRIAGLIAVLQLYLNPDTLPERLPTLRLLTRKYTEIKSTAHALCPKITQALNNVCTVEVIDCKSQIGSGALPTDLIPSAGLSIRPRFTVKNTKAEKSRALIQVAKNFRRLPVPIIGKLNNGALELDLRCLEQINVLTDQLPILCQIFGSDK